MRERLNMIVTLVCAIYIMARIPKQHNLISPKSKRSDKVRACL